MKTRVMKDSELLGDDVRKYPCLMIAEGSGNVHLYQDEITSTLVHTPVEYDQHYIGKQMDIPINNFEPFTGVLALEN